MGLGVIFIKVVRNQPLLMVYFIQAFIESIINTILQKYMPDEIFQNRNSQKLDKDAFLTLVFFIRENKK